MYSRSHVSCVKGNLNFFAFQCSCEIWWPCGWQSGLGVEKSGFQPCLVIVFCSWTRHFTLIKLIFSTHANVDEWMVREVWQTACSIWLTYYSGGVASHWNRDRLWQHEPLGSWTKLDSHVVNKFLLGREEPSKTSLASNVWLCNSLGSWAQSLSEGHEHESRWSLNLSRLVFCNGWNCILPAKIISKNYEKLK